jgi:diacylglycerol kinase (ATP)
MTTIKPKPQHALIIVNPVSGKLGFANKAKEISQLASTLGWKGGIVETTKNQGADTIINQGLKKGLTHFVVCGGDGSISQAVSALAQKPALLGVVPGGTGNLFVQNLSLPLDPQDALKIALTGTPSCIDVGVANGTYFTIMTGMGLDAKMVRDADRQLKNRIGILAYLGALIKNISQPPVRYTIAIDQKTAKSYVAKSVMVANLGRIHGGLEVVPHTDPQNGTLKVGLIQASGFWPWVNIITHGLRGHIDHSPQYTLLEGSHIVIKCQSKPQPFECDGSDFPAVSELVVDIMPQSLWILDH